MPKGENGWGRRVNLHKEDKVKEQLIRKLTSRKLWLAVATLVTGLILAFGGKQSSAQTVSGCIMSLGSVVAYIFGEGLVDCVRVEENNKKGGEEYGDQTEEEYTRR